MNEQRPLASLSSSLLARKGGAKPAIRRRDAGGPDPLSGCSDGHHDDLGWNDMGGEDDFERENVSDLHPVFPSENRAGAAEQASQEEATATYIGQAASPSSTGAREWATARAPMRKTNNGRKGIKSRTGKAKAAFTLRLDAERHLKLRLATTMQNISAQQLITKAMDEYLKTIPELDDLAERVPSRGTG